MRAYRGWVLFSLLAYGKDGESKNILFTWQDREFRGKRYFQNGSWKPFFYPPHFIESILEPNLEICIYIGNKGIGIIAINVGQSAFHQRTDNMIPAAILINGVIGKAKHLSRLNGVNTKTIQKFQNRIG